MEVDQNLDRIKFHVTTVDVAGTVATTEDIMVGIGGIMEDTGDTVGVMVGVTPPLSGVVHSLAMQPWLLSGTHLADTGVLTGQLHGHGQQV